MSRSPKTKSKEQIESNRKRRLFRRTKMNTKKNSKEEKERILFDQLKDLARKVDPKMWADAQSKLRDGGTLIAKARKLKKGTEEKCQIMKKGMALVDLGNSLKMTMFEKALGEADLLSVSSQSKPLHTRALKYCKDFGFKKRTFRY